DEGAHGRGEESLAVDPAAVLGPEAGFDSVLGGGHESHDVARFVRDPGDAAQRTARVQALVAEDHPVARFEFVEHLFGGDVAALTVLQRDADRLTPLIVPGPRGGRVLDDELLVAADEVLVVVADERTGQQMGFAEDLEPVADAQHRHALPGRGHHGLHDRVEAGDRTAAQIVTIGESAGQDDGIDAGQGRIGVPQVHRFRTGQTHGTSGVPVIERSGEGDDSDRDPGLGSGLGEGGIIGHSGHDASSATRTATTFSITGLDRSFSAASRACASTASVASPSTSSSNLLPCRTSPNPVKPSRVSPPTIALPCGSRISGLGITSTTTRAMRAYAPL